MIAKDALAVRVTTLASESAFSSGGRLVSPSHSRLHSDMVETHTNPHGKYYEK
ncbi:Putative AC transposase [Linum perenne]